MKKCCLLVTALLISSLCLFASADEHYIAKPEMKIILCLDTYDSCEYLECDVDPVIVDDYTLIPLRALAEKLDFTVEWFEEDKTVHVKKEDNLLMLTVDMKIAGVNGKAVEIPVAPMIVDDRAMLPLRFVAEYFEKKVFFDGSGDVKYIWITDFDYLTEEDLTMGTAFRKMGEDEPFYSLKQDAKTAKDIRIGCSLSQVTSAYGSNAEIDINTSGYTCLTYYTLGLPEAGMRDALHFNFKNNILVSAELELAKDKN